MAVTIEKRKRKRGTAVLLCYRDQHGKRHRRTIGTAESADALAAIEERADLERKRIEYELASGTQRVPIASSVRPEFSASASDFAEPSSTPVAGSSKCEPSGA